MELLVLTSPRSRVILELLDILVDIGVPAEKEVIQWGTVYVDAVEEALVRYRAPLSFFPACRSLWLNEFHSADYPWQVSEITPLSETDLSYEIPADDCWRWVARDSGGRRGRVWDPPLLDWRRKKWANLQQGALISKKPRNDGWGGRGGEPQVNSGRGRPEWDLSYENSGGWLAGGEWLGIAVGDAGGSETRPYWTGAERNGQICRRGRLGRAANLVNEAAASRRTPNSHPAMLSRRSDRDRLCWKPCCRGQKDCDHDGEGDG